MSRFSDFRVQTPVSTSPSVLPRIDWASIGAKAPIPIKFDYHGADAPLPLADIVMITWTDAEWSAMDHVFLRSTTAGDNQSTTLVHNWFQYSRSAPSSGSSTPGGPLWGYYQLVEIASGSSSKRVLLFKADAHLAHSPWITGLENMVKTIATDARPKQIYSIGTAGGAVLDERLGDVAVTNSGKLQLKLSENLSSGLNGKTFTSNWFPSWDLMSKAQKLFFPLAKVASWSGLERTLDYAKRSHDQGAEALKPFTLQDLVNSAIDPGNLNAPRAINYDKKPLLTTDYYFIADAAMDYAALEMDDAVIGYAAQQAGCEFVFVRNISDPLVPTETPSHKSIPSDARSAWSSAVYNAYGLYTSFNGAITAWATIAGS